MDNIFWTGYSNNERHSVLSDIKNMISKHGDIVDFKLFSDISITIVIEIAEFKIDMLYKELAEKIGMDKFEFTNSNSKKERTVYMNLSFTKGTGNLKIEVPSVPG